MPMLNALDPTPEQIQTFLQSSPAGEPVFMLNLLKFKDRADYKDGEDVSGRTAYMRYAKAFKAMLSEQGIEGAESIFGGQAQATLIGTAEGADAEWDAVAIVRYSDAQTMFATVSSDAYRAIHKHRKAGLAGQLLISCSGEGIF